MITETLNSIENGLQKKKIKMLLIKVLPSKGFKSNDRAHPDTAEKHATADSNVT